MMMKSTVIQYPATKVKLQLKRKRHVLVVIISEVVSWPWGQVMHQEAWAAALHQVNGTVYENVYPKFQNV